MRKWMLPCLLATVIILVSIFVLPLEADATSEYIEGYYTYAVIDGEAIITDCNTAISGEVDIPDILGGYSVTGIGKSAFYDCRALTKVVIPDSVVIIGDSAFEFCGSLSQISFSANLTEIGNNAFYCCSSLTNITIPYGVKSIGSSAFYACYKLTEVQIPATVTSIGGHAFGGPNNLTGIWVDEKNRFYSSDAYGVLFNKDKTELLRVPCSLNGSYIIPEGVQVLADYAIDDCKGITEIYIPASVSVLQDCTIEGCVNLEGIWVDVDNAYYASDSAGVLYDKHKTRLIDAHAALTGVYIVPDSVERIEGDSFAGCKELEGVILGESVTEIYGQAFYNSGIQFAVFPESISYISSGALWADNLLHIYYEGTEEQWGNINIDAVNNGQLDVALIHYGKDTLTVINSCSYSSYACAICDDLPYVNWNETVEHDYKNSICTVCDVEECWEYAIRNNMSVAITGYVGTESDVDVPMTIEYLPVTKIEKACFAECSNLISVSIPTSITAVGRDAFASCDSLKNVYYDGNCAQWGEVSISSGNDYLEAATLHPVLGHDYATDSTTCVTCGYVRVSMEITSAVLKPVVAGVYFKGAFSIDEDTKVTRQGITVSVTNPLPVADDSDASSLYTVSGVSALISGILKADNTDLQNSQNAMMSIYARAYVLLEDGTYIYSDVTSVSLRQVVEGVDAVRDSLSSAQTTAIDVMYQSFADVMQFWDIPKTKEDLAA